MRKLSYLFSCVVIGLILTTSQASAMMDNTASRPAEIRPMKMDRPVERPQKMNDSMMVQQAMREQKMASRPAMMEDKMASRPGQMSKKAEFREKLEQISDTDKQAIVEKIDTRIASMNTTQTAKWMEALTKMDSVLSKISSQGATLKAQGQNTTALDTTITNAQTAITTAKAAVNAQASKEYVINITSETALKTNVGSTVSQFRTDSRTTRQSVSAARAAVVKAFVELTKLTGQTIEENASHSGSMRVQ